MVLQSGRLRDFGPPPPGLNSQEPPTPPTVPVLAPLLPCTPSNPTEQPPTPPREQTPAKRPVSHRKREPFRPFLYASFNSRNSPFYCCKKFNFSRSLNVSPIVAQSPDENPLFTVSEKSENSPFLVFCNNCKNSLFNGSGKSGKSNPAGWHFSASACGISSARLPGAGIELPRRPQCRQDTTRGRGKSSDARALDFLHFRALFRGCGIATGSPERFCTPSPPRRVCRFRRGCCPQHLREPGTNPPIFPVQEHGTRREK